MPSYLSDSGVCASRLEMTATPPRFNPATFDIVLNAAAAIGFKATLLFRDQREPFESLLIQLTSSQTKFRPSEMGAIIEAKMMLQEALSECSSSDQLKLFPNKRIAATEETSPSVHEDGRPRAAVHRRQFSNSRGNDAAFSSSSSGSPLTDSSNESFTFTPIQFDNGDLEFLQSIADCKFLPLCSM